MTLKDFVNKYMGKKVDFDGKYGAQCVDLARRFYCDVWELARQPESVTGAKDFANHEARPVQRQLCNFIKYKIGMMPREGAVIVFDASPANKYGHIGICVSAGPKGMELFEQDGFRQENGAQLKFRTYESVLGWLVKNENIFKS